MVILLVGLTFLILSFSSYGLAYQINGINRVIISTPISIFEASILHDLDVDDQDVRFSKEILKDKTRKYYGFQISKYTDDYIVDFYFYNPDNESLCVDDDCYAVEISISANLMFNYEYERTLKYEIGKSDYGL